MKPEDDRERVSRPPAELPSRRIDAARHFLKPHCIRDSLALKKQLFLRTSILAGLQAAATVAIALPLINLSAWSHLIGFGALGSLVALFGRFAPQRGRKRILFFCALCQASAVFLMSLALWLGVSVAAQFVLLALAAAAFFLISSIGKFGPPGAVIFVFAAGAAMGHVDSLQVVAERTVATAAVAALAWIICVATEAFRPLATLERPFPVEPVRSFGQTVIASLRVACGAGIAVFVSHQFGADHPVWAAMGAVAVMQGERLHITMNRAWQRMLGTIVGALLIWPVLLLEPSVWAVIGLLIILSFSIELIIGANYGLGQILLTPMALLMTHLASPHVAGATMATERVFDTLVGATVGIGIAVIFSSIDDRRELAAHHTI